MTTRRIGARTVKTSSEERVFFPGAGLTKGDLIDYYRRIADTMLPHLRDRPIVMQRFPDGIDEPGFYHKETPDYFPRWIQRRSLPKENGQVAYLLCSEAATLVYLANQGCITPHVWLSREDRADVPDRLVFDLDPSDDDCAKVRTAAQIVTEALDEVDLAVFLQLTGSRGIHVVSPIQRQHGFDTVRRAARGLANQLARLHPELLTTEQRKAKRGDRVYLDTGRNAYAQTMVAPYAVRARALASVATPITRRELERSEFDPRRYTIRNIFRRLGQVGDPWAHIDRSARSTGRLLRFHRRRSG